MAHCRCSFSESSGGGLPLEKLALSMSMSGESDLQRLAGSEESLGGEQEREEDEEEGWEEAGGPGACWSIRKAPLGRSRFLPPPKRLCRGPIIAASLSPSLSADGMESVSSPSSSWWGRRCLWWWRW